MNLEEELSAMLVAAIDRHPVWSRLGTEETNVIPISGPLEETLQQSIGALNAYCDVLLSMVMRIAETVDELAEH